MYVKNLEAELRLLKVYDGDEFNWILNFLFNDDDEDDGSIRYFILLLNLFDNLIRFFICKIG